MQNTLVAIILLFCSFLGDLFELFVEFIGNLLGLFIQDYRVFIFFLVFIFIVSSTFLLDQIRLLVSDIKKWKRISARRKTNTKKNTKKSTYNKTPNNSGGNKSKKSSSIQTTKGKNVIVKKDTKNNSEKIILKKNIKTPGVKSTRSKSKAVSRRGA